MKGKSFVVKGGASLRIDDIPPFEPCLIHLCCLGAREFQLDLMRALKARGFRFVSRHAGLRVPGGR